MVHTRYMGRYPVRQVDWREHEPFGYPVAPDPDELARTAWASEALTAAWPDCWPCADRLALLDLCNPRVLDGDVRGANSFAGRLCSLCGSFFLSVVSRFRGIPAVSGREFNVEQSVDRGHPDR